MLDALLVPQPWNYRKGRNSIPRSDAKTKGSGFSFAHVLGVDASKKCIAMAEKLKAQREAEYSSVIEGDMRVRDVDLLPKVIDVCCRRCRR